VDAVTSRHREMFAESHLKVRLLLQATLKERRKPRLRIV
jgi:hypothetical protein